MTIDQNNKLFIKEISQEVRDTIFEILYKFVGPDEFWIDMADDDDDDAAAVGESSCHSALINLIDSTNFYFKKSAYKIFLKFIKNRNENIDEKIYDLFTDKVIFIGKDDIVDFVIDMAIDLGRAGFELLLEILKSTQSEKFKNFDENSDENSIYQEIETKGYIQKLYEF